MDQSPLYSKTLKLIFCPHAARTGNVSGAFDDEGNLVRYTHLLGPPGGVDEPSERTNTIKAHYIGHNDPYVEVTELRPCWEFDRLKHTNLLILDPSSSNPVWFTKNDKGGTTPYNYIVAMSPVGTHVPDDENKSELYLPTEGRELRCQGISYHAPRGSHVRYLSPAKFEKAAAYWLGALDSKEKPTAPRETPDASKVVPFSSYTAA